MSGFSGNDQERRMAQAYIYYQLGRIASEEGISTITIFGVKNGSSWIIESHPKNRKTAMPLIFDDETNPMLSYYSILMGLLSN